MLDGFHSRHTDSAPVVLVHMLATERCFPTLSLSSIPTLTVLLCLSFPSSSLSHPSLSLISSLLFLPTYPWLRNPCPEGCCSCSLPVSCCRAMKGKDPGSQKGKRHPWRLHPAQDWTSQGLQSCAHHIHKASGHLPCPEAQS